MITKRDSILRGSCLCEKYSVAHLLYETLGVCTYSTCSNIQPTYSSDLFHLQVDYMGLFMMDQMDLSAIFSQSLVQVDTTTIVVAKVTIMPNVLEIDNRSCQC